jgi:hypothetical protein
MGDKSPKSRDRQKKQHAASKEQQKTDAYAKAHPAPALPLKQAR